MAACTRSADTQASQHSSTEAGGNPVAPPTTEKILKVDSCYGRVSPWEGNHTPEDSPTLKIIWIRKTRLLGINFKKRPRKLKLGKVSDVEMD